MFVSFLMEKIADAFRHRQNARELSGLSDRELSDLGLVRTAIGSYSRIIGV